LDTSTIIVICVLSLFLIFGSTLWVISHKKRILKMLAGKYGKPSTRTYDERDFTNIRQLFSLFPSKGKEIVDDITWNDLQMSLVYQQINHSVSHIGDEYLYRHIRTQQYDELDRLEKHIQYFDAHPEERLKLQYAFYKINQKPRTRQSRLWQTEDQKIGHNYVAHLKDPNLFPKISIIPSVLILILAIMACISTFFFSSEEAIGFLAVTLVFAGSIVYFTFFARKTANFIPILEAFCASINASTQVAKLDLQAFDKELKPLIPVIKKLQKKSKQMLSLVNICMMQIPQAALLTLVTIFFGLYGFVYLWVVKTIKNNIKEALISYESIGYIELCIGLSSYRKTLPYYCIPEFSNDTQIKFDELYHPLLKKPVTNSKTINQKFIITGANASGKSTFIKTLAINAITAQTINICYAKKFTLRPAYVYTAMNLNDDIITGDSFYMAEIKRLKAFLDFLNNDTYTMLFADEILKGTNTTERIAAASVILKRFAENNCFFCLATHDTELTGILQHYYSNYHFKEITTDEEIYYDYKLYDGVTPGSNAIALLKVMQYEPLIVDEASKLAQQYINSNQWEILQPNGKVVQ
jgi:hypothetical protein